MAQWRVGSAVSTGEGETTARCQSWKWPSRFQARHVEASLSVMAGIGRSQVWSQTRLELDVGVIWGQERVQLRVGRAGMARGSTPAQSRLGAGVGAIWCRSQERLEPDVSTALGQSVAGSSADRERDTGLRRGLKVKSQARPEF